MLAHWKYLKHVLRHKWFVFIYCLQYRLIWRGIKHDWSKFLPSEWNPYVDFFYRGESSTKTGGSIAKRATPDFEIAWNHHQKRNDHHWQYWVRLGDDGTTLVLSMPDAARKEMIADWRGAGRALGKPNTWEWYEANKDKMQLHPHTRILVETELARLKEYHRQLERFHALGF